MTRPSGSRALHAALLLSIPRLLRAIKNERAAESDYAAYDGPASWAALCAAREATDLAMKDVRSLTSACRRAAS